MRYASNAPRNCVTFELSAAARKGTGPAAPCQRSGWHRLADRVIGTQTTEPGERTPAVRAMIRLERTALGRADLGRSGGRRWPKARAAVISAGLAAQAQGPRPGLTARTAKLWMGARTRRGARSRWEASPRGRSVRYRFMSAIWQRVDKKVKAMFSPGTHTRPVRDPPATRRLAGSRTSRSRKRSERTKTPCSSRWSSTGPWSTGVRSRSAKPTQTRATGPKEKSRRRSGPTGEPETKSKLENALEYLETWANDRSKWKFRKVYQACLLSCLYDRSCVGKAHFKMLPLHARFEGRCRCREARRGDADCRRLGHECRDVRGAPLRNVNPYVQSISVRCEC